MFRTTILTAVLGTGLIAGLTLTPATADAHPPIERFHHEFEVVILRHGCWERYGRYCDLREAERIAHHLRREGRAAEVRR